MDNVSLIVLYSIFFVSSLVFSILINALFLKFSKTLGTRNNDESFIRWSSQSKPSFGGISFFISFLLSIVLYTIFIDNNTIAIDNNARKLQFLGIISAATLAFLIGLADDAYNTKPLLKFLGQLSCAAILIFTGTYIKILPNYYLNIILTVLWVVGMMNSINMFDNMDAISSVVSISVILCTALLMIINNNYKDVYFILLLCVLASLVGFLKFNWHPSKMYMGDTGSQFLGLLLASIGILFYWNSTDFYGQPVQSKQFISGILIFLLPLIDTTTVVINRLMRKTSPFVGGKDHTSHHLSYLGLSDTKVALVFAGFSVLSLALVLIANSIEKWTLIHFFLFGAYAIVLFIILFIVTKITKAKLLK